MSERKDRLWQPGAASQEEIEKLVETSSNPIGLDVGTSKIAVARQTGNDVKASSELNAFFQVPHSRFTEKILEQNQITNYREGDELVIYGTATERFANMFNAEARRPMADGLLNPRERAAMSVIEAILKQLLPKAVEKAREWMKAQRNAFEEAINTKLNDQLTALEKLRGLQMRQLELRFDNLKQSANTIQGRKEEEKRHIDKLFDDYLDWVQETMTTEEHAFIQVAAILVGQKG